MPIADFQRGLADFPEFGDRVYRAVRARVFTTEQIEMCNVRHSVVQRLARWLLVTGLRVTPTDFSITHEFLASMLCARRASITEAVGVLEDGGAVAAGRSSITVADSSALAARACECWFACRDAIAESIA